MPVVVGQLFVCLVFCLEQTVLQLSFFFRQFRMHIMFHQKLRIIIEVMGIGLLCEGFAFIAREGHILQIAEE